MPYTQLFLRNLTSPYGDTTRNSVLSWQDVDQNFIFLKGEDILTATTSGSNLIIERLNGEQLNVDLSALIITSSANTFVTGITINTGVTGGVIILERNDGVNISGDVSSLITYTNLNPTVTDVGGVEAGSTFNSTPLQDMWTDLLYPELTPKFTTFDLSGIGTIIEVGRTISSGPQTFTWTTSNSSFIQPNTVIITDITNSTTLASGTTNDGSEIVNFPVNIQKTSVSSHKWRIKATRTNNSTFYKDHTITWYWRKYWGESVSTTLTSSQVTGLTNTSISNVFTDNYNFLGGGYKYIVIPNSFGSPNLFKDEATNLQVAMADNTDGYTNYSNGYYYQTVSITNQYGITTTYRIYRTKNILGGAINIIVT